MARLVRERGKLDPSINYTAHGLTWDLLSKDHWGEIERLFCFVRDEVRYARDIRGVDTLTFPEELLWKACGDCDDKSVLLNSLLETMGFKTAFKAIGPQAGLLNHVYSMVHFGRRGGKRFWLALDTTENYPMGWEPPKSYVKDWLLIRV